MSSVPTLFSLYVFLYLLYYVYWNFQALHSNPKREHVILYIYETDGVEQFLFSFSLTSDPFTTTFIVFLDHVRYIRIVVLHSSSVWDLRSEIRLLLLSPNLKFSTPKEWWVRNRFRFLLCTYTNKFKWDDSQIQFILNKCTNSEHGAIESQELYISLSLLYTDH